MRASGATAMFQKNIPERVIQKVTGHRSLHSLRAYERISTSQHTLSLGDIDIRQDVVTIKTDILYNCSQFPLICKASMV